MAIESIDFNALVHASDYVDGWSEEFGYSADIDGDYAVVGCLYKYTNPPGETYGAAYVFFRSEGVWSQQAKLEASDKANWDVFGISVAISGDTIVVGASGKVLHQGAVYVFTRSGVVWSEQQKIIGSDSVAGDYFGNCVDIDGDTLIAGAPLDDDAGIHSGTAFIWTRAANVWTQQQKIAASDAAAGSYFGMSIGLDGDSAIIGAPHACPMDNGAAYIFTRTAGVWTQQQRITGDGNYVQDSFADYPGCVSISGDTCVVGAIGEDELYGNSGAIYIFQRDNEIWTKLQRIPMPIEYNDALNSWFGRSVKIDEDCIVVGAVGDKDPVDPPGWNGSAFIYQRQGSSWELQQRIHPDPVSGEFGSAVSIDLSSRNIIICAHNEDSNGAARFYDIIFPNYFYISHQFNLHEVCRAVGTLTPRTVWNQFDEHGLIAGVNRIRGETNWEYKRRILDTFVHRANSSYQGLVNGITRELGLSLFQPISIVPKINPISGNFYAPDPYIRFDGAWVYLYYDYVNDGLEHKIDRYALGGNYEHIIRLVNFINSTTYFEASIEPNVDPYTPSMTILNQSNRIIVSAENIPVSTKFALNHNRVIPNSEIFSDKSTFARRALFGSSDSSGKYHINYEEGIVAVYSPPDVGVSIRYEYQDYPFKPIASPVILHDITNENFRTKMFEQVLQDDGSYVHGSPTEAGVDIINELLSVVPMYWGK